MHRHKNILVTAAVVMIVAAMTAAAALGGTRGSAARAHTVKKADEVRLDLTPSSAQLRACMPNAQLEREADAQHGEARLRPVRDPGRDLPPNRDYTIFLLQQAGSPFGAAEYIGDFSTNDEGNTHNDLRLIVQEAFSSTLVNGSRLRVDLNRIGVWFADPKADDFCLGVNSPITPFDGDNEAGVQAFNSANADPLPAP